MAEAKFPHWRKRFRTTIWKSTAIKNAGAVLTLSTGKGNTPVTCTLPAPLAPGLRGMRRCRDTGQTTTVCSVEQSHG